MDVEQQDHQDIDPSWINEAYLIDRQRLFISQFKNAYPKYVDSPQPDFYCGLLHRALDEAIISLDRGKHVQNRPLAIYLHNDHNLSTSVFCRDVLCDREVVARLKADNWLVWPWDITNVDDHIIFLERVVEEIPVNMCYWRGTEKAKLPQMFFICASPSYAKHGDEFGYRAQRYTYRVAQVIYGTSTAVEMIQDMDDFKNGHIGRNKTPDWVGGAIIAKYIERFGRDVDNEPQLEFHEGYFTRIGNCFRDKDQCPLVAVLVHNSLSAHSECVYRALCDPAVTSLLQGHFLLFGWDLTLEENARKFWKAIKIVLPKMVECSCQYYVDYLNLAPMLLIARRKKDGQQVLHYSLKGATISPAAALRDKLEEVIRLARDVDHNLRPPDMSYYKPKPRAIKEGLYLTESETHFSRAYQKLYPLWRTTKAIGVKRPEGKFPLLKISQTGDKDAHLIVNCAIILALRVPEWLVTYRRRSMADPRPFFEGFVMVPTGSSEECLRLPGINTNATAFFLDKSSDFDSMLVVPSCPIENRVAADTHLAIDTSETMPGYLRLKHIGPLTNTCYKHNKHIGEFIEADDGSLFYSLTSGKHHIAAALTVSGRYAFFQGPAITVEAEDSSFDTALAVRCHDWPVPEWQTRRRPSGWPSADLIQQICQYGCHFVSVDHAQSTRPEIEWRFSFTVAEKMLALSLIGVRRTDYGLFKSLITFIIGHNSVVSSYCLKNVFFWVLEEIPPSYLANDIQCIGRVFSILLDKLIHFLVEGNLPHYFIRENNLIMGKPREAILALLKILTKIRNQGVLPLFEYMGDSEMSLGIVRHLPFDMFVSKHINMSLYNFEMDKQTFHQHIVKRMLLQYAQENIPATYYEACHPSNVKPNEVIVQCENVPGAFLDMLQKACNNNLEEYALGFAWCLFVSKRSKSQNVTPNQLEVVEECFLKALDWAGDKLTQYDIRLYYGLFLVNCTRYDEARVTFEQLLSDIQTDARKQFLQNHKLTFVTVFDACVLDVNLNNVVTYQDDHFAVEFDFISLVYHLKLATRDTKESTIQALNDFRDYCCNTPQLKNRVDRYWTSIQLLSEDLRFVGFPDKAVEILELIHLPSNVCLNKSNFIRYQQVWYARIIASAALLKVQHTNSHY